MDLTARLLRALTDPEQTVDPRTVNLGQLSDEALGTLMPAAYGARAGYATAALRYAIGRTARERQPRYTPEACRRMFEALAAGLPERRWADLTLGVGALLRCTGPWPELGEPARTLVAFLLDKDDLRQPYALFTVAGLAGESTLQEVSVRLTKDGGPLLESELAALAALSARERAWLCEADRAHSFDSPPPLPDVWPHLAESPAYLAFARRALESATLRVEEIQAGTIPYRADKAFAAAEVVALGHAARVALWRDEPWLPQLLDRLLPAVTVAPTAAKTVPSQALLYEIARAGEEFPTPELVTALRSARSVSRHAGVPKQLDRKLRRIDAALAERADVALRLPGLGFDQDGVLKRVVGDCTALVRVAEAAELVWERDGRPLRSLPASVRKDHAEQVKELRELVKRANVQQATLTRALEGGCALGTVHRHDWWREALVGHPLAGPVARRLIWEIEISPGAWGAVLPEADELPEAADDAGVRLWHPIRSDPATVRAWRDRLTERELRQPFKQAFREIYPLTPAEEESGDNSLRFAGHLVHYRRLFALFRARGWRSGLLGPWDGGSEDVAVRTLAASAWQIRFEHALADHDPELAVTGRIRFARREGGSWRPQALSEVPELVFSEAMRDVDLFVAVTSIALDPDWAAADAAADEAARGYRERFGSGELSETAAARHDALERVLPRLRIADRCTLEERFLVVRGERATYRIHLGSANIVMEPSGTYLCVVPARGGAAGGGRVFLPFEDECLSLILSKAFLLADDSRITDASILSQIGKGA